MIFRINPQMYKLVLISKLNKIKIYNPKKKQILYKLNNQIINKN